MPDLSPAAQQALNISPGAMVQQGMDLESGARSRIQKATQQHEAEIAPLKVKSAQIGAEQEKLQPPPETQLPTFEHKGLDPQELGDISKTMFALAAIGGLMTRAPMTTALNAFSAGINGLAKGDKELFDREYKTFQTHYQAAIDKSKMASERYRNIIEKNRGDMAAVEQQLRLAALEFNDTVTLAQLDLKSGRETVLAGIGLKKSADQNAITLKRLEELANYHRGMLDAKDKDRQVKEDALLKRVPKGAQQTQRAQLVVASARNTLSRLGELQQTFGEAPRSSLMFGAHPEGLTSRAGIAVGNTLIGEEQRKIDAAYNSIVDEAIPVFTGGLRGSDSYRRFLISQMPGPGDDDESAKEKLRLFAANVNGTLNTFSTAFQSNPAFHGADEGAPASGGGPYADPDKEARYQKWKAEHPQ